MILINIIKTYVKNKLKFLKRHEEPIILLMSIENHKITAA